MSGLDDDELAAHSAEPLPAREQMSLMTAGGLGSGLVDVGATGTADGGTDAAGSTEASATTGAGDSYTGEADGYRAAAQDDLARTAPAENDSEYSPTRTATATGE